MDKDQLKLVVLLGSVMNIMGGLLNVLIGFFYIFLCYGIFVMPIGVWQVAAGILAMIGLPSQGKNISNLAAAIIGVMGALVTFNVFGLMTCGLASVLLAIPLFVKLPEDE